MVASYDAPVLSYTLTIVLIANTNSSNFVQDAYRRAAVLVPVPTVRPNMKPHGQRQHPTGCPDDSLASKGNMEQGGFSTFARITEVDNGNSGKEVSE
jgi:hypothetical protein